MDDKNMLAPLHALLDPAYPENLRMVAEWLFVQLVEDEEITEIPMSPTRLTELALLALRQTERLSAEIGGMNFYLNKGVRYRASLRDREMFERFNGRNYDELARTYGLTPMRVRQIIGAMMVDEVARRQGKLDLE
jgi:Mor family transcriptional regulator